MNNTGNIIGAVVIAVIVTGWLIAGSVYFILQRMDSEPEAGPIIQIEEYIEETEIIETEIIAETTQTETASYDTVKSARPAYDIIIQAGQSNSMGGGLGEVDAPYEINDAVWYFNSDFTFCEAFEREHEGELIGNFSLTFAQDYVKNGLLAEGRRLLIIRSAEGGSGFSDFRWGPDDDLQLRMIGMIAAALELNPENKLVAFLWHQGETDATLNATRDGHYKNLITLIDKVRTTFDDNELPFVAGDFVPHWKTENEAIAAPVIAAIRDVCADIGYAGFVETDGLLSNDEKIGDGNTSHFSREALYEMGRRYFREFMKIKNA